MPPFEKQEGDPPSEEFEWTVDNECHLFTAMADTKPAGINKHFHMLEIVEKFSGLMGREISTSVIWKHLETLYDMKMCDEIEGVPFPNDVKDFTLPEAEFGSLIKAKTKALQTTQVPEEVEERPQSPRIQSTTPRSTSRGAVSKENTPKVTKKEHADRPAKERKESESSTTRPQTPIVEASTPSKPIDKETVKPDPRRDSKDSNASSKEGGSVKGAPSSGSSSSKTPIKESKATKSHRASIAGSEKSEDSSKSSEEPGSNKRGTKRPLRGSLKPEDQPTPPSRRRRI